MPVATYDDATLILKLYEIRREEKMRHARDWFTRSFLFRTLEEYQKGCPPGSQENAFARMVISYWEMVASFVTSGVLGESLFFQSGQELMLVYDRLRDILPEMRQMMKSPIAYRNLEEAGKRYADWLDHQAPGAFEAFSARTRGMR